MHTYYIPQLSSKDLGKSIDISGDEARHLLRVLRARVGTEIKVFNGVGGVATANVTEVKSKHEAKVSITSFDFVRSSDARTNIAVAIAKGDRFETMIDMLTQVGIDTITPINFTRSVVSKYRPERCQKIMIEASKQSRRAWLPILSEVIQFNDWLSGIEPSGSMKWIADPNGSSSVMNKQIENKSIIVIVGPEGGLTNSELNDLQSSGFESICLGQSIMRIETAAVAFASLAKSIVQAG